MLFIYVTNLYRLSSSFFDKINLSKVLLANEHFFYSVLNATSITIAFLTLILGFIFFTIKRNITTAVICTVLFCSSLLESFNLLVATSIISISTSADVVSFFWLFSHSLHPVMLALTVGIFLLQSSSTTKKIGKDSTRGLWYLRIIVVSLASVFTIILLSDIKLNYNNYYSLIPLLIYTVSGIFLFPKFYKRYPSPFSYSLLLSIIPAIIAQLHLVFVSKVPYNSFFLIHAMNSISYLIPLIGLVYNYLQTYMGEKRVIAALYREITGRIEAQLLLKGVLDNSPEGIMAFKSIRDRNNKIIDFEWILANNTSENISGLKPEFLIGQNLLNIYPKSKDLGFFDKYCDLAEEGMPLNYEYYSRSSQRYFQIYAKKLGDGFTITIADITNHKINEEKIKKNELLLLEAQELARIGNWEWNVHNNEITWSKELYKLYGYSSEKIESAIERVPVKENHIISNIIQKVLSTKKAQEYQDQIINAEGEIRIIVGKAKPLFDEKRNIIKLTGFAQDITERKEAEKKLYESQHFIKQLTDSSPNILYLFDLPANKNLYVNQQIQRMLHYSLEESMENNFLQKVLHPSDLNKFPEKIKNLEKLEENEVLETVFRMKHKNGNWKWFLAKEIIYKRESDGRALKILGSAEDITDRRNAQLALIQNKRKFEAIFNNAFQFISLLSVSGKIIDTNKTTLEFTGAKLENLIGTRFGSSNAWAINKNKQKILEAAIKEAAEGKFVRFEAQLVGVDKRTRTIDISIKPMFNEKGKVSLLIAEGRDISERKEAEEKLKASETLLSEAEKIAHYGSWKWVINSDIVTWSDELYRIYGYEPGEIQVNYNSFIKHIHPDDREIVNDTIKNSYKTKQPFACEYRVIRKDDSVRTVLGKGRVITDEHGKVVKILGSALDITEQNKINKKILRSISLYQTMAKNIPNSSVLLFDTDLVLTLAEGTSLETLEYPLDNLLGKKAYQIYNDELQNLFIPLLQGALHGKEAILERKSNGKYYKINIIPVKNNEQEIFACMKVSQDITKIKQYQQELETHIEELNNSNKELEQFAYVASHDLQEPLRKIRAFGDMLSAKFNIDEEARDYIDRMQSAASRMQTLIEDLLSFSRLSREFEPFVKTDLTSILKETLNDLEIAIIQKNAVINFDELPIIDAIPGQIRQLFQNLISNALKFNKKDEPPIITIKSEIIKGKEIQKQSKRKQSEKYCRIYIQDNGIGFDEKFTDRIFVIFQRLQGRQEYEGTGIGLAVCKKIVEIHRGYISVNSEVNKGSTFIITLPIKHKNYEYDQLEIFYH